MEKKTKDKLIAGAGAGVISAVAKEPFSNDSLGGYSRTLEKKLAPIKINDKIKLNYHIAGLTKKAPIQVLSSLATYSVYDALKGNKKSDKKESTIKKLGPALIAGGASAAITYPLANSTSRFPKEIENSGMTPAAKRMLRGRTRLSQSLIAAPVGLVAYDLLNGDSKDPVRNTAAGVTSGALGSVAISYGNAKYDALRPETEAEAAAIGKKLSNKYKFFERPTSSGISRGHMTGRIIKTLKSKIPAGMLGFGAGLGAYQIIKNKLQKKEK